MKSLFKRIRLAWDVLRADEVIVVTYEENGLSYHHDGTSMAFLHVFMKIIGNTKLWIQEWIDLNAIKK